MPQVVTANRLADGRVVFLTAAGGFSPDIAAAAVADDDAAAQALLAMAEAAEAACRIVGPYLIEVRRDGGHVEAVHMREAIRARGPTVAYGPR